MRHPASRHLLTLFVLVCVASGMTVRNAVGTELRMTPIVKAVQGVKESIVNIHGHKTISTASAIGDAPRQVNGMGTGVIVDERGYIITNQHVVEGVRRIQVTLNDGTTYVAQLIAFDEKTDLALIKIDAEKALPVVTTGTSSDLMPGETVIAVGNAYGYENSVTRGIISALHRTVQVSDTQKYYDLIQTDASINPGNSGGPLLNIDGEMIGINVAVRVGAQGIGFAIPADTVMEVASQLMSIQRLDAHWHGIVGETKFVNGVASFHVKSVEPNSPASLCGIQTGDVITAIDDLEVCRMLDVERALLDRETGEEVSFKVSRGEGDEKSMSLVLQGQGAGGNYVDAAWELLGIRVQSVPSNEFRANNSRYRGGLRITAVKAYSPAARQQIRVGDVLVGMHEWETISVDNLEYILKSDVIAQKRPIKFYILRDNETFYGDIAVANYRVR
ncbi:trypsin-like peptidase domain-containing protein [Blastopirellula sp. JC732]|uniref:Trypsin-like peptidase domain-containing protein n=1 Tax=Blastopirellula sediminis TaxID=2894196 RepID=A0A9X1MHU1_9BACT|nr:trypsin-like peptidase domain-containing protein [Blastopirellula sediminis]MCC9607824.1 trypsin-like peptidase domain-containing protein [Blastopirellula sediminis]MCC9627383.1 trypsin-like peptidase domain-containing protein [Blastopirellula sediminis]